MIDIKKKNGTVIYSVNADTLVGLRLYNDVNLTGAYLADANLSGANLDFTNFFPKQSFDYLPI